MVALAEGQGLVCPGCGCSHFWVLYTRRTFGGRLLRRRECRHCGRRVTTYEMIRTLARKDAVLPPAGGVAPLEKKV